SKSFASSFTHCCACSAAWVRELCETECVIAAILQFVYVFRFGDISALLRIKIWVSNFSRLTSAPAGE
ncbi:hypothetical protein, partial [Klebsiella pneumoniae]|uniref:hypothetical protein n=1 Tax=Klebsiella pneumoniae TaxID=573 RepID=UPI001953EF91